ncbi:MAG TPA: hydantoinase/oxoprolinase family protein [Syntrophobacteraceae bacterium]|nr:hydantoinase/oxoprolinase family protein [Syntrophobacteraceae bacterium]
MIIGLDVGGTHTDVVLLGKDRILQQAKVPTRPSSLLESVWSGIEEVTRGIAPEAIERVVLSTTLTTNAIAEGKLAETGMIVSSGPGIDPEGFRTCREFHCVRGSIDHRGREIQPIDRAQVESAADGMRSRGVRYVGVVGKFSIRNPKHENEIVRILGDRFEHVVLGHRLSGNLNFPRRVCTAYLNAAVYPVYKNFFEAVSASLKKKGLRIPIYILKADGGTVTLEASLSSPGQTILSGPAASVMGSVPYASREEETLVLDIGGTTTDMAVLVRGVPLLDPVGIELGGYKTLIRSLKTHSVAIGGDSAVRLEDGRIQVGPDRQGPAMAYGGTVPTPTDALAVMGKAAGGDSERARQGLLPLAQQLGVPLEEAAARIFDHTCKQILEAAAQMVANINRKPVYTVQELLEGHQVRPTEILVLGGPAPLFAFRFAAMTDFRVRVVPRWQVANAVGAALARSTCEVTLFVDTERGFAVAPEESFHLSVRRDFDKQSAVRLALELLRKKCTQEGSADDGTEMELVEELQFNMVRGFYTTGRNIRVKAQVKPGLIPEHAQIAAGLFHAGPTGGQDHEEDSHG